MQQKTKAMVMENDEKRISFLLSLIFFCLVIVNLSPVVASISGFSHEMVSTGAKGILAVGCVINVPILLRRLKASMVVLVAVMVVVYLGQLALFSETEEYFLETFGEFATLCMPAILYCFALRDYEQLRKTFIKTSLIISGFTLFLFAVAFGAISSYFGGDSNYAQGLGYSYLIPILFLIQDYIKRRKIISLLCSVMLTLIILAFGSRGPLLGIGLFSISYLYRYLLRERKIVFIFLITLAAAFLLIQFDQILYTIISLLQKLGINSRSLTLFTSDLMNDAGRSRLQMPLMHEFWTQPFAIRGISADWLLVNSYAHNIVVELLYEFGILLGGAIIGYFAWCVGRTALADINRTDITICFIFLCASITSLFVSGTVWASQTFWIWFALQHNIFHPTAAERALSDPQTAES